MTVKRLSLWVLAAACLGLCGCPPDTQSRKPDPTKGTVTGLVLCSDTGRPARFASVQLLPVYDANNPGANSGPIDLGESGSTGLDGRFKIEAVPPGEYYAFAMLDGYIDPTLAIDQNRLGSGASDRAKFADEIEQWKDHLVTLTVAAQHTSDISISIDRGAEIDGTVSYDDGSPAAGVHFEMLRKTANDRWLRVGSGDDSSPDAKSDGRGRYSIENLAGGEYRICALLPDLDEDASPPFCYGGGYRINKAETVTVAAGDTRPGVDIVLPLDGLFTVSGNVAAGVDGHAPAQATVHLLYQDDGEEARRADIAKDGTFSFAYVPAGAYILQVTGAQDAAPPGPGQNSANGTGGTASPAQTPPAMVHYLDKEMPVTVQDDMEDITIPLSAVPPPARASSQ